MYFRVNFPDRGWFQSSDGSKSVKVYVGFQTFTGYGVRDPGLPCIRIVDNNGKSSSLLSTIRNQNGPF